MGPALVALTYELGSCMLYGVNIQSSGFIKVVPLLFGS